jgi:hypothetical protein
VLSYSEGDIDTESINEALENKKMDFVFKTNENNIKNMRDKT